MQKTITRMFFLQKKKKQSYLEIWSQSDKYFLRYSILSLAVGKTIRACWIMEQNSCHAESATKGRDFFNTS